MNVPRAIEYDPQLKALIRRLMHVTTVSESEVLNLITVPSLGDFEELARFLEYNQMKKGPAYNKAAYLLRSVGPETFALKIKRIDPKYKSEADLFLDRLRTMQS